jgi:hypothetical protein
MFREWLGDDQVIDLKLWAQCIGIRQAYLATLPQLRCAAHLIVLDDRNVPQETLRVVLDNGTLRLHFIPPAKRPPVQDSDLGDLAAYLSTTLRSDPRSVCTIVLDPSAASELALSMVCKPRRAAVFHARLASGYGERWAVRGANPLLQEMVTSGLTLDWAKLYHDAAQTMEDKTLIWHCGGLPATRGGTRFQGGQFHLLAPEELVEVSGAIWIDERLIGELILVLSRMLQRPRARTAIWPRLALIRNLVRGYVRRGSKAPPLRWLILALIGRILPKPQTKTEQVQDPPRHPEAKLALYACLDQPSKGRAPLDLLMQALASHPQVKVSIGWTRAALEGLDKKEPDQLDAFHAGVQQGRFEGICTACSRPFALSTSSQTIRAQVEAWTSAAQQAGSIVATGFAPPGGKLCTGWSAALSDGDCRFLALPEAEIRQIRPGFAPTRPVTIEGWPIVGLHRELSQVLSLDLQPNVLASYLRLVSADYQGGPLAIAVPAATARDVERLGRFLDIALAQGYSFVLLGDLASTQSQGIVVTSPHLAGLEPWVSDEINRRLNALIEQTWYHSCVPEDQEQRWFARDDKRETLIGLLEQNLARCRDQALVSMMRRRPLPALPADAAGLVRVVDPSGLESRADLLEVQIPNTSSSAEGWAFIDNGVSIASQLVEHKDGTDRLLLDIDMGSSNTKDLVVLPTHARPAAQGLDITPNRLCNPWLAVLLDERGQVTSIHYRGQEKLFGPSNGVRGYLLQAGQWLHPEREPADIAVTEVGPLSGTVTVRQTLAGDIELTRHIRMTLSSPLIECITEIAFPAPCTFGGSLTVGLFRLMGQQMSWSMPLQAGTTSQAIDQVACPLFAAEDAIDVHTGRLGLRYLVHRPSTRTYLYTVSPASSGEGIELGLIASMPGHVPHFRRLFMHSGLGFPGHTYAGRYTYRYALLPLGADTQTRTAAYNSPLMWTFYPRQAI